MAPTPPRLPLSRLRHRLRPRDLPWWVFGGGLLLTLLALVGQWRSFRLEHERLEQVLAEDVSAAVSARMNTHLAILDAVLGLFHASEEVNASEFARFYASLDLRHQNFDGIQGVGFAAVVPAGGAGALEQRMRRQGQPDFTIRPPGQRPLLSTIQYLQPPNWRNERAVGFDMYSEPTRRQAMALAATTGETVLSAPVRLLQETSDNPQAGALLYAPLYANSTAPPGSRQERWRRLRGWAYSPLRMGDLLSSTLRAVQNPYRPGARVVVFDGVRPEPTQRLFDSRGLGQRAPLRDPTWVELAVAGRSWLIGVELGPGAPGASGWDPALVMGGLLGVSLSGLAAVVSGSLVANHLSLRRSLDQEAQAARERALAAAVFDTTPVGIVVTDPDGIILQVNHAFTQISGFSELEARGHKANLLRSGRHDDAFYRQMWEAIVQRGHWSGEIWNRHRNGQIRRHELNITAVLDGQQQIVNFVGLLRDVTERYSQDRRMRHLATHDQLTGLANRGMLMEELERCLARAQRQDSAVGLLFLDLNGFKAVNDSRGHSCGDALLQAVARRLRREVRTGDLLCRQGGDEFVLLIPEAPDCDQLRAIAAKLLTSLEAPFAELGADVRISASVGVARWPDHAADADGLLDAADNAMYLAKQHAAESPAIAMAGSAQARAPGNDSHTHPSS